MYRSLAFAASLLSVARSQLVGTEQTETHPGMTWQSCTAKGSCTTKNGKIVIDANWRWLHVKGGYATQITCLHDQLLTSAQIHQLLHWQRVERHCLPRQQVLRIKLCDRWR